MFLSCCHNLWQPIFLANLTWVLCLPSGHVDDESFLKECLLPGQEDILGSNPTARTSAGGNLQNTRRLLIMLNKIISTKNLWDENYFLVMMRARSGPFFNLLSVIFCMDYPCRQYFPAKVNFWHNRPPNPISEHLFCRIHHHTSQGSLKVPKMEFFIKAHIWGLIFL